MITKTTYYRFNYKDGISPPPAIQNRRNSIQIHPYTPRDSGVGLNILEPKLLIA